MHNKAVKNGWALPYSYEGYAFPSYESQPLPTNHISVAEVLKLRDDARQTYFTNPAYLDLVKKRFGLTQRKNVEEMATIHLKRKILGD